MTLRGVLSGTLQRVLPRVSIRAISAIMLLIALWAFSHDGSSQEGSSRHNSRMSRPDTFGAGWTAESLANLEIGMRPGRCVSYRFRADHAYGLACYQPGGCAEVIETVAQQIDASKFNRRFPRTFPRFVQHAIWHYYPLSLERES